MPQTESQKKSQRAYIASGKRSQVVITMRTDEKAIWDQYAKDRGIPLATLLRQLMQKEMESVRP